MHTLDIAPDPARQLSHLQLALPLSRTNDVPAFLRQPPKELRRRLEIQHLAQVGVCFGTLGVACKTVPDSRKGSA